ncbi:transcription termination/antitermination protein NusG [Thioclava electrotropha]|uniref:Transcription termination/antitermination protein NusG n=1 Tax=Thioclava electrotropha TaxID=1549850 RepID=A0ABX6YTG9_9RHOB|nr:transcription termination/antitermination NusG family protein [Thioclava electrotropha]QPZ91152.1 transcriptional activator RfaH [Thioclava electrotropha]
MTDQSPARAWHVAQFKPNSAAIARRNLERQRFDIFLPMVETTRRQSGKFVTRSAPLFPGYLFVREQEKSARLGAVNGTQGITRLVALAGRPTPVSDAMIEALRARCDTQDQLQPLPEYAPGDEVTLATGPFADFVATVEKVDAEKRVWLLLDFMGRETRIKATSDALI